MCDELIEELQEDLRLVRDSRERIQADANAELARYRTEVQRLREELHLARASAHEYADRLEALEAKVSRQALGLE